MFKTRYVIVAAWIALAGCGGGGGGSNDQGVSLRALGVFFEEEKVPPDADIIPVPGEAAVDVSRIIVLGQTFVIPDDLNGDGDPDGGLIGMQNRLFGQSINVQGLHVEIVIQGALLNNPIVTDFVPLSVTLGPADAIDPAVPNDILVQSVLVTTDIMAFLNQNQTLLPTPPFNMTVVMTLEGVSDSGDTFDSNEFTYDVIVATQ